MRILYAKPLPAGNATRIILQPANEYEDPENVETAWKVLRRQAADPVDADDPAAFVVYYGGNEADLIDSELLVNGVVYHYAVFPRANGTFQDPVRFNLTPARSQRIYGDEPFLLLRDRVAKYIDACVADGELNPPSGFVKTQVTPPIFEETAWPVVTLSLITDRPEVRSIGDGIGGEARLSDGQWYEAGGGWLSRVQIAVTGWSKNGEERLLLRRVLKAAILGQMEVLDAAGLTNISVTVADHDELQQYPVPVYCAVATVDFLAPSIVLAQTAPISDVTVDVSNARAE